MRFTIKTLLVYGFLMILLLLTIIKRSTWAKPKLSGKSKYHDNDIKKDKKQKNKMKILFNNDDDDDDDDDKYENVIIKISSNKKKRKRKRNDSNTIQILSNNIYVNMKEKGIYGIKVNKKQLHMLFDDGTINLIEPDHSIFLTSSFLLPREERVNSSNNKRELAEAVSWGVDTTLQNRTFWSNLPEPSSSIKICIADTGYDMTHDDLPKTYVNGSNNPNFDATNTWDTDNHGHGSHVAGIIAAIGNNDKGTIGIIPNNYNGKFELIITKAISNNGEGTDSDLLLAVESCVTEHNATIVSLSLGGYDYSQIASEFYNDLFYNKNILLFASSGNDGTTDFLYPASYKSVISIAAVDTQLGKAGFSQYNSQVELSAPGVSIYSTYKNNKYYSQSGTSMATPFVAGVAGLLRMYFPDCANVQIRNVLAISTIDNYDTDTDIDSNYTCNEHVGYGLVQAINAYNILSNGDCGGYLVNSTSSTSNNDNDDNDTGGGGCNQIGTHSIQCSSDINCNDNDPCTVDKCTSGTCTNIINDCSTMCNKTSIVIIKIHTDNFPMETTWSITNENSNTSILSGGPYSESKLYTITECLNVGTYHFIINDEYSDGLCCDEGNGYYSLTVDNTIITYGSEDVDVDFLSKKSTFEILDSTDSPTISLFVTDDTTNPSSVNSTNQPSIGMTSTPSIALSPVIINIKDPTSYPSIIPSISSMIPSISTHPSSSMIPSISTHPSSSMIPTNVLSNTPSKSNIPTNHPSNIPSKSVPMPTPNPSLHSSIAPSSNPSINPTISNAVPIKPSIAPDIAISTAPTIATSAAPTIATSAAPTIATSAAPTIATSAAPLAKDENKLSPISNVIPSTTVKPTKVKVKKKKKKKKKKSKTTKSPALKTNKSDKPTGKKRKKKIKKKLKKQKKKSKKKNKKLSKKARDKLVKKALDKHLKIFKPKKNNAG